MRLFDTEGMGGSSFVVKQDHAEGLYGKDGPLLKSVGRLRRLLQGGQALLLRRKPAERDHLLPARQFRPDLRLERGRRAGLDIGAVLFHALDDLLVGQHLVQRLVELVDDRLAASWPARRSRTTAARRRRRRRLPSASARRAGAPSASARPRPARAACPDFTMRQGREQAREHELRLTADRVGDRRRGALVRRAEHRRRRR